MPARTRQFVPFVQGARSRFTNDEKFFCCAKIASLCHSSGTCGGVFFELKPYVKRWSDAVDGLRWPNTVLARAFADAN